MLITLAHPDDDEAIRQIIMPVIRGGETSALPTDGTEEQALAYWLDCPGQAGQ